MLKLAGVVVLDEAGRILMLHRNTPKRIQWETPGGKIEDGETAEACAIREFGEELKAKLKLSGNLVMLNSLKTATRCTTHGLKHAL